MTRALILVAALCAPMRASATGLAILELRLKSVPPALRGQLRLKIEQALVQSGYKITTERRVRAKLKASTNTTGCTFGPCLEHIGRILSVERALVGNVASQGTSYDITLTLLETGGGTVLSQVNKRCDVCNFKEVETAAGAAAQSLHKKALVVLSNRATLVIDSRPPEADVLIDGLPVGKTPLTRLFSPGNHTVAVAAKGHSATTQHVLLEAGKTQSVMVTLISKEPVRSSASPATKQPRSLRWVKWVALGTGVALGSVGGGLIALDGNETSDPRYVHDTRTAGIALVSLGVTTALAATLVSLLEGIHPSRTHGP